MELNSPYYDEHKKIIKQLRNRKDWEYIEYFGCKDEESLEEKLEERREEGFPEDLDAQLWIRLVSMLKKEEESAELLINMQDYAMLGKTSKNTLVVPEGEGRNWVNYWEKLRKSGWSEKSLIEIRETTHNTLNQLTDGSNNVSTVKGLVVGNVQSGKTANMAALMAMAADWGWNMFIVLTGTIDNLRRQTQDRLYEDLNIGKGIKWVLHEHVSAKKDKIHRTQSCHFDSGTNERHLTVCLKNKTRLENLYGWLVDDPNKLQQMKILIIDDEADQGSINTKDISKERSAINKAILDLVNIQTEDGRKPKAMNYISYTATPYANVLNESSKDSLYPNDFIGLLNPADEYFGPKQIFGLVDSETEIGLPIIREIIKEENEEIQEVHKGESTDLPKSFQDAIAWFVCCVAAMRYRKYKKPISMLVHTSQKQDAHKYVYEAIDMFFTQNTPEKLLAYCKEIYLKETKAFDVEDFKNEFRSYPKEVEDYPAFEKIEKEVHRIIKNRPAFLKMEDKGSRPTYQPGLHIAVDNCANNGLTDEGEHIRLLYPEVAVDSEFYPKPAPAFLVIGGSTLSRGLTIEGLVSTYFLRTTNMADTLMQMGRWFGYRKGYEMYPRIWITEDTRRKFKFLATLEEDLRNELRGYAHQDMSAKDYGPKIRNSPKLSWLSITSRNKSQSAVSHDLDFSGVSSQTTYFDNNREILENNIQVTETFLGQLGNAKRTLNNDGLFWTNVPFDDIKTMFLQQFTFNHHSIMFSQIETFIEWYEKKAEEAGFEDWNVVVAGRQETGVPWKLPQGTIYNINRSRLTPPRLGGKDIIDIGVLRDPKHIAADITKEEFLKFIPENTKIEDLKKGYSDLEVREKIELDTTPQLLIYRMNADFVPNEEKSKRYPTDAAADIIGVSLIVPGVKSSTSLATSLTVKLPNYAEDDVESE